MIGLALLLVVFPLLMRNSLWFFSMDKYRAPPFFFSQFFFFFSFPFFSLFFLQKKTVIKKITNQKQNPQRFKFFFFYPFFFFYFVRAMFCMGFLVLSLFFFFSLRSPLSYLPLLLLLLGYSHNWVVPSPMWSLTAVLTLIFFPRCFSIKASSEFRPVTLFPTSLSSNELVAVCNPKINQSHPCHNAIFDP